MSFYLIKVEYLLRIVLVTPKSGIDFAFVSTKLLSGTKLMFCSQTVSPYEWGMYINCLELICARLEMIMEVGLKLTVLSRGIVIQMKQ